MSITGKVKTLFSDKEKTEALFPRTKVSAVSDENGVGLNVRLKNAAPRNLLDNSDFRNPVNQRGQTSLTTSNAPVYMIDRWFIGGASATANNVTNIISDGVELVGTCPSYGNNFRQYIPIDATNKTMTFAVCDTNGNIIIVSGKPVVGSWIKTDTAWGYIGLQQFEGKLMANIRVTAGNTHAFCWAVLYEGEYTAETLPEYQPKGYGAELAECQRYYWQMSESYLAYGHGASYGNMTTDIVLPVEMRVNPTVSYTLETFIINGEDKKSELNRVDVECSTKRLRFSPVTLNATYKNQPMRMCVSDIKLSADL